MSIQLWHKLEECQKRIDMLEDRVRLLETKQSPETYGMAPAAAPSTLKLKAKNG